LVKVDSASNVLGAREQNEKKFYFATSTLQYMTFFVSLSRVTLKIPVLLEAFFKTHAYLVEHNYAPVRRALMDQINWNDRLIGIKGSRGVGKTTFLLQYAREHFGVTSRKCLYINMNNFYFQGKSISDFAAEFYRAGGRTLLIDQIFKEPHWSSELRKCYEQIPGLQIVFTGSSVMRLKEENAELNGIVSSYSLRGFSFREYLNLRCGIQLKPHSLEEILNHHTRITSEVCQQCNPLDYFHGYLRHGYYPFFLGKNNYVESLLKVMNMMIEVDILLIKQIDLKYLNRLKKLLYLIAVGGNVAPNVSQLATEIGTSRATVMNYIKYLSDARLINILYRLGEGFPKKPSSVTMHNPNLMQAILPRKVKSEEVYECFFQNALWPLHNVSIGDRTCTFFVDGRYRFRILNLMPKRQISGVYYVMPDICRGYERQIPLWLFGFLY